MVTSYNQDAIRKANDIKTMAHDVSSGTVIYVVQVCRGQYDDYWENEIFATADKARAEKWRDRYNRIIDDNKERIDNYYDDQDWSKPEPFWYSEINWDVPRARVIEIEWR
jgi:predicted secreted protein